MPLPDKLLLTDILTLQSDYRAALGVQYDHIADIFKDYNDTKQYTALVDACVYNGILHRCVVDTTGTFNASHWQAIGGTGAGLQLGKIVADTTFYLSPTGSDTLGDGSASAPWYSPHRALAYLDDFIIAATAKVTILALPGDYLYTEDLLVRHADSARIEIKSNGTPDIATLRALDIPITDAHIAAAFSDARNCARMTFNMTPDLSVLVGYGCTLNARGILFASVSFYMNPPPNFTYYGYGQYRGVLNMIECGFNGSDLQLWATSSATLDNSVFASGYLLAEFSSSIQANGLVCSECPIDILRCSSFKATNLRVHDDSGLWIGESSTANIDGGDTFNNFDHGVWVFGASSLVATNVESYLNLDDGFRIEQGSHADLSFSRSIGNGGWGYAASMSHINAPNSESATNTLGTHRAVMRSYVEVADTTGASADASSWITRSSPV